MKSILVFVAGGVLGIAAGFAVGIFVYPYLFLADRRAYLAGCIEASLVYAAACVFRLKRFDCGSH
ncbi:MAG: hypothetical protein HY525_05410 [Betaproteobacteria bacterium]|nr:hypothetical protein [Betaproteobacteria bacterium]